MRMNRLSVTKDHPPSSTELDRLLTRVPEMNRGFDPDAMIVRLRGNGTVCAGYVDGQAIGFKVGYDLF